MKYWNLIGLLLFLFISVAAADLDKNKYLAAADNVANSRSSNDFNDSMKALIKTCDGLSQDELSSLYEKLLQDIDAKGGWAKANKAEKYLIGVILSKSKNEDLMAKILMNTPPSNVGFISLETYLKECPVRVIAAALRGRASQ